MYTRTKKIIKTFFFLFLFCFVLFQCGYSTFFLSFISTWLFNFLSFKPISTWLFNFLSFFLSALVIQRQNQLQKYCTDKIETWFKFKSHTPNVIQIRTAVP